VTRVQGSFSSEVRLTTSGRRASFIMRSRASLSFRSWKLTASEILTSFLRSIEERRAWAYWR
jgi:hypothetical protein